MHKMDVRSLNLRRVEQVSELKVVVGMNEGKVLCISNDKRIIKSAMSDYLFETSQEFDVDFFELRNWGEYDIEIFNYEYQPTLNENQQVVLDGLKFICANYKREFQVNIGLKYTLRDLYYYLNMTDYITDSNKKIWAMVEAYGSLSDEEFAQVLQVFSMWSMEQECGISE